jgi:hypothetical protein
MLPCMERTNFHNVVLLPLLPERSYRDTEPRACRRYGSPEIIEREGDGSSHLGATVAVCRVERRTGGNSAREIRRGVGIGCGPSRQYRGRCADSGAIAAGRVLRVGGKEVGERVNGAHDAGKGAVGVGIAAGDVAPHAVEIPRNFRSKSIGALASEIVARIARDAALGHVNSPSSESAGCAPAPSESEGQGEPPTSGTGRTE